MNICLNRNYYVDLFNWWLTEQNLELIWSTFTYVIVRIYFGNQKRWCLISWPKDNYIILFFRVCVSTLAKQCAQLCQTLPLFSFSLLAGISIIKKHSLWERNVFKMSWTSTLKASIRNQHLPKKLEVALFQEENYLRRFAHMQWRAMCTCAPVGMTGLYLKEWLGLGGKTKQTRN